MSKTKILAVGDGGITTDMLSKLYELEKYNAEVTIIEDTDMSSMGPITNRMLKIEQNGVDAAPTYKPLLDACEDADIIVVHVASINKDIIEKAKKLKLAVVLRGGVENADLTLLKEKNIPLIHAPWRSAHAVADFTVGMMIAENKNIARSHKLIFDGVWEKKYTNQAYIHDMRTRKVGLFGFGNIGQRVAERLKGFGCDILVHDPYIPKEFIEKTGAISVSRDELLKESDFISLHLRLTDDTRHYIDTDELSLMKDTAYLINTGRSGLIKTDALIKALDHKSIGGAAIDVFDEEPLPKNSPFLSLNNVTLTSHIAGTSADTMQNSVEIGFDDLVKYLNNKKMDNIYKY